MPTGILANHQLDRKQVTPTAILRVLISEVGCDLHPIIVMTTKYVMICSSPHIRRIISCSLNVYRCSQRFTHSSVNEIKRHGSRKECARLHGRVLKAQKLWLCGIFPRGSDGKVSCL